MVLDEFGYFVIDTNGNEASRCHYDTLYSMSGECPLFAARKYSNGKFGILELGGKVVFPFEFDDVDGFDDLGWWKGRKGRNHLFFDRNGVVIRKFVFDKMSGFFGNIAVVENDGKTGIVSRSGKMILPCEFFGAQFCNQDCIAVRTSPDGDFLFYYFKAKRWGNLGFDYCMSATNSGAVWIERSGAWSLYDNCEKCLLECFATEILAPIYGKYWQYWSSCDDMGYAIVDSKTVRFVKRGVSRAKRFLQQHESEN